MSQWLSMIGLVTLLLVVFPFGFLYSLALAREVRVLVVGIVIGAVARSFFWA